MCVFETFVREFSAAAKVMEAGKRTRVVIGGDVADIEKGRVWYKDKRSEWIPRVYFSDFCGSLNI